MRAHGGKADPCPRTTLRKVAGGRVLDGRTRPPTARRDPVINGFVPTRPCEMRRACESRHGPDLVDGRGCPQRLCAATGAASVSISRFAVRLRCRYRHRRSRDAVRDVGLLRRDAPRCGPLRHGTLCQRTSGERLCGVLASSGSIPGGAAGRRARVLPRVGLRGADVLRGRVGHDPATRRGAHGVATAMPDMNGASFCAQRELTARPECAAKRRNDAPQYRRAEGHVPRGFCGRWLAT
jgi:hypothetical protein